MTTTEFIQLLQPATRQSRHGVLLHPVSRLKGAKSSENNNKSINVMLMC